MCCVVWWLAGYHVKNDPKLPQVLAQNIVGSIPLCKLEVELLICGSYKQSNNLGIDLQEYYDLI